MADEKQAHEIQAQAYEIHRPRPVKFRGPGLSPLNQAYEIQAQTYEIHRPRPMKYRPRPMKYTGPGLLPNEQQRRISEMYPHAANLYCLQQIQQRTYLECKHQHHMG